MLCKISKTKDGYREESRIVYLPKTERKLGEALMDMGIGRENGFEYGISGIKTGDAALNNYIEITEPDIDELNYIAGFIDSESKNPEYRERLAAVLAVQMPGSATDFDELMKAGGGKITKYGYVARNDKPFEPVYKYTEQEQGMALQ
jgi:hypothetical protein